MPSRLLGSCLLALAAMPLVPASAERLTGDEVYRCRDARGQSHFGQNIPAPCMDLDVEVLDSSGRVVRVIPGRRSMEQVAQQRAAEEAAKVAAQRDRTLLATYISVADIERLREAHDGFVTLARFTPLERLFWAAVTALIVGLIGGLVAVVTRTQ